MIFVIPIARLHRGYHRACLGYFLYGDLEPLLDFSMNCFRSAPFHLIMACRLRCALPRRHLMACRLPFLPTPARRLHSTRMPSNHSGEGHYGSSSVYDQVGSIPQESSIHDHHLSALRRSWASDRYKHIQRPYTAMDVVSKRGTLLQAYPSSLMASKLFTLLEQRFAEKKPISTCTRYPHQRKALNV